MVGGSDYSLVGRPFLANIATIKARVAEHFLAPDVVVFKKKRFHFFFFCVLKCKGNFLCNMADLFLNFFRRKGYRRKKIHQQEMTSLCITDIEINNPESSSS